jgi:hypothetical protein
MLMCRAHWSKVPENVQRAVYATYRRGQCDDKRPSREWHEAADAAIGYVAEAEGQKFNVAEARAMAAHGVASQRVIDGLAIIDARRAVESNGNADG